MIEEEEEDLVIDRQILKANFTCFSKRYHWDNVCQKL